MNIARLKSELESLGVPRLVYSLSGAKDERLCLEIRKEAWVVFFVERGKERVIGQFGSESDACEFMLAELRHEL